MAKPKRSVKSARQTALIVIGEGAADQAFITHMKGLFNPRGSSLSLKVEAGDGGSAGNIITHAIRAYKSIGYDQRILVLDSDLPPSAQETKSARQAGYEIILWSPQCLEGALLETLGERVNDRETSQMLKARLHPRLAGASTDAKAYAPLFPKPVLEATRNASVAQVRDAITPQELKTQQPKPTP